MTPQAPRLFSAPCVRLLALVFGFFFAVDAAFAAKAKFDIPAQPALAALKLFIKQSGVQVVFSNDQLAGVQANEVIGEMEAADALNKLLAGTGFEGTQSGPKNFVVKKSEAQATTGSVKGSLTGEVGKGLPNVLVAIKETSQSTETDRYGVFVFPNVAAGTYVLVASAPGYQTMHIEDVNVKAGRDLTIGKEEMRKLGEGVLKLEPFVVHADTVEQLEKFEVSAAREKPFTTNMDISRTINDSQPYYIFDSNTIESSGATNVEDFLKQRLSMNATALTNAQNSVSYGAFGASNATALTLGNNSEINLRGLGSGSTLVLVNGRKVSGTPTFGSQTAIPATGRTPGQADLNGIPLAAIERIEVLPSSASAIYGGSALGGVINVILKKQYTGGEIDLNYDNSFDSDSANRSASIIYGKGLNNGRTQFMISAQASDGSSLLLQDRREVVDRGLAAIQANNPTYLIASSTSFPGALPNIQPSSSTQTSLILKSGQSLGSRLTFVPAGTSSTTSGATLTAGLIANAGKWNLDLPSVYAPPLGLLQPLGLSPRVKAVELSLQHNFFSWLQMSGDYSHSENHSFQFATPVNFTNTETISASLPANPFATDVRVSIPIAFASPATTTSSADRATFAINVNLPWDWVAEGDYSWSRSRFVTDSGTFDFTGLRADITSGLINPFTDTLQNPIDAGKYLGANHSDFESEVNDFALRGSGPVSVLPWGKISLTLGLEHYRLDRPGGFLAQTFPVTTTNDANFFYYADRQTIDSVYGEAQIPLFKSGLTPVIRSLELQLAGRLDHYDVSNGTTYQQVLYNRTPPTVSFNGPTLNGGPYFSSARYSAHNSTVGFKYETLADITLRASVATAFLPPNPTQLLRNPTPNASLSTVTDPRHGNATVSVQTISGGNSDLTPQNSKSVDVGVVWEPHSGSFKGLRLNAEYYKVTQNNAISSLTPQVLVANEDIFPGRVTRDSSGNITLVDVSFLNLYKLETEGLDLSVSYDLKTSIGTFSAYAVESTIRHLYTQYSLTLPKYDAVNFPSESGAAKYKGNASLSWQAGNWKAGWAARYFGPYQQFGALGGPTATRTLNAGGAYTPSTQILAQGSSSIPSQIYHDFYIGYSFHKLSNKSQKLDAFLDGVSLELGLRNAFNKLPPLDVFYPYFTSPYGDLRRQSYWISLRKQF